MEHKNLTQRLKTAWVLLGSALILLGCIPLVSLRAWVTLVPLAPKACTLAGCSDSLQVNVQGEMPALFRVSLTGSDGSELASDCDLALLLESQDACTHPDVAYYGEYLLFRAAPSRVVLRLEWAAGNLEREITPAYEWFYPNGPDCAPKCRKAQVEVTIP